MSDKKALETALRSEECLGVIDRGLSLLCWLSNRQSSVSGFWSGDLDFHDKGQGYIRLVLMTKASLFGEELGEIVTELRRADMGIPLRFREGDNKPEGLAVEICDLIIRMCDVAGKLGLNLPEAMVAKMRFNAQREFMHGKHA